MFGRLQTVQDILSVALDKECPDRISDRLQAESSQLHETGDVRGREDLIRGVSTLIQWV